MRHTAFALCAIGLLCAPAPASADRLLAQAPGAAGLAANPGDANGHGPEYQAWFTPDGTGRWKLTTRAPDGVVSAPAIPSFASVPQASIGLRQAELVVTYGRDDGDVYSLNLRTGLERRVAAISSRRYRETAPLPTLHGYVFVRRGGPRPGIYVRTKSRTRRVSAATPTALAFATSSGRIAYADGNSVVVRGLSAGTSTSFVIRTSSAPLSVAVATYRVAWLEAGGRVFQSGRITLVGSPKANGEARPSLRTLPSSTTAIAVLGTPPKYYLDATGVWRVDPPLFLW
ncbi:MAG TPA: hypothetical protein VFB41_08510 [Solirubrobacteraceae bacterium]|nr:hypothetical protein [Solirubrobacteraceae bacterium]